MRILEVLFRLLLGCGVLMGTESHGNDDYSIREVKTALQVNLASPGLSLSFVEKQLQSAGDAASIGLLKVMDQNELTKVESVRAMLNIIRQAFSNPPAISKDVDKKPKVTLFLLVHLHQDVSDAQVRSEIQQTIEFVKGKCSE